MKPVFNIAGSLVLAVVAATTGCTRTAQTTAPAPLDGGDAQRLVALLDYVGGDYGRAVKDGKVVSEPSTRSSSASSRTPADGRGPAGADARGRRPLSPPSTAWSRSSGRRRTRTT